MSIFEEATRMNYKFPYKGTAAQITVIDLWDLETEDLDRIFKVLNRQLKSEQEESLLGPKQQSTKTLETKIAIIKHIVDYKIQEKIKKDQKLENKEKKKRVMNILADKQYESLRGKSEEELKQLIESL